MNKIENKGWGWERWFAWYPIQYTTSHGRCNFYVWLKPVLRRKDWGNYYTYREDDNYTDEEILEKGEYYY